jgi:glutamyl-tRNA synthetase
LACQAVLIFTRDHDCHSSTYPFRSQPTGYLHLGGARTALFSWAYARRFGGTFVLRIEDTDVERSTPEAVQAIIEGMQWLGLEHDEGPFYQMKRMDRYREVMADAGAGHGLPLLLQPGGSRSHARTPARRRRKAALRRHLASGAGQDPAGHPAGRKPVVRFKNPQDGEVSWDDVVKGPITISNRELDDLVIARPDGTPTYNFCVVVDDWDMGSPRHPRRRPRQQHAAPDQHPEGTGAAAGVRPPADDPGCGWPEAVQAPRTRSA